MNHRGFSPIKDLRPEYDSRPNKRRFERTSFRERANHGRAVVKAAVLPLNPRKLTVRVATGKIISAEGTRHPFDRRPRNFLRAESVSQRSRRIAPHEDALGRAGASSELGSPPCGPLRS